MEPNTTDVLRRAENYCREWAQTASYQADDDAARGDWRWAEYHRLDAQLAAATANRLHEHRQQLAAALRAAEALAQLAATAAKIAASCGTQNKPGPPPAVDGAQATADSPTAWDYNRATADPAPSAS